MVFFIQNSDFSTRIASLYWSQPLSVVLCIHNSDIMTELIVSMGPRPHLSFCAFKTAWLASNTSLYGSLTSPVDLWIKNFVLRSRMTLVYWTQPSSVVLCIQNSDFSIRMTSLYGSLPSSVVFSCKTAAFWSELQVSNGPRPHLGFLHSKQHLYHHYC